MSNYTDYFAWLADPSWIRVSARAIIFNHTRDRILVERNDGLQNAFYDFVGGGVEVGETLEECLARELREESDANITGARYLFVVENFISHGAETRHALEHYFEIELEQETVTPKNDGVTFSWIPIDELGEIDLRPVVARDAIRDGTYAEVGHMILQTDE